MKTLHWLMAGALALGTATPALAGKEDDTLRIAKTQEVAGADFLNAPSAENHVFQQTVFDALISFDPETGEFLPLLATSWEQIDDATWEFKLRDDVTFHDGSPFNADDVVYTINFMADPDEQFRFKVRYTWMDGAEKIDDYTVRIKSKGPNALALAQLATVAQILPSDVHEALADKSTFGYNPIGTGAYRVESIDSNEGAMLVRRDDYPQANKVRPYPAISKVFVKQIPDEQTRVAELLSGNYDLIGIDTKDLADRLADQPGVAVTPVNGLLHYFFYLDAADRTGTGLLTDIRVRQAIAHAIDIDTIRQNVVAGGDAAAPMTALCLSFQVGCDAASTTTPAYDPDRARALLAEAGKAGGFEMEITTRAGQRDIAEAIVGYLHEVGIRASLNLVTEPAYREMQTNGQLLALVSSFDALGIPDVAGNLPFHFSGDNRDYAQDARLTELTTKAGALPNPEERMSAIGEALDIINDQVYLISIAGGPKVFAHSETVELPGTEMNGFGAVLHQIKWK